MRHTVNAMRRRAARFNLASAKHGYRIGRFTRIARSTEGSAVAVVLNSKGK